MSTQSIQPKQKPMQKRRDDLGPPESSDLLKTRFDIPSIGVGTLRTSATWIAVMLMAEDNPAEILADTIKELGISPEEIFDYYHDEMCASCGMSKLLHRQNNGECL